jgi:hypothetical protein
MVRVWGKVWGPHAFSFALHCNLVSRQLDKTLKARFSLIAGALTRHNFECARLAGCVTAVPLSQQSHSLAEDVLSVIKIESAPRRWSVPSVHASGEWL